MPHANHNNQEWIQRTLWPLVVVFLAVSALFIYAYTTLPSVAGVVPSRPHDSPLWPASPKLNPSLTWSIFEGRQSVTSEPPGSLAARFRLAGTFVEYGGEKGEIRKAVLDNLKTSTQTIVSENQPVADDVTVVSIFRDTVILRGPSGEEQLRLTFSEAAEGVGATESSNQQGTASTGPLAGIDRFGGKRIGERRWVFRRKALEDYYSELMEEPERLVKVFDSLKPLYDKSNKITGYTLGIEGEAGFFKSVGLQEADIVRSVNSVKMTNRRRAEYFIREFVQERANAFVLEVERNGKIEKHIYQTR